MENKIVIRKRERHLMPDFIRIALDDNNLMADYLSRPAYQRNDYIGWICRAVTEETKIKRMQQMLAELRLGGVYMNMKHTPSIRK